MKRKALLKAGGDFVVLEESDFEAETDLQEALKRNPAGLTDVSRVDVTSEKETAS